MKAENPNGPCPQADSAERKRPAEGRSAFKTVWRERDGEKPELLEKILDRNNLNRAYRRVKANKGAPGIDGMTVKAALGWLKENRDELIGKIKKGKYKPKPVKRKEIPKPDGGVRKLGIPTVVDRIIQQAVAQLLEPIYEPKFADGSYGYRPGRSAHDAISKIKEYAEQGYIYAVSLDLSKYFDTIDHAMLLDILRRDVKDERVIQLIKRFLKSGVMEDGAVHETTQGSPQGGTISPLLANIFLNEFDQEFTARGVPLVRYADDIVLLATSRRAAERLLRTSTEYLTNRLGLTVNQEKSRVTILFSQDFKYLGFTFTRRGNTVSIRPHPKAKQKIKRKLKQMTKRNRGRNVREVMSEITPVIRGWIAYYAIAEMKTFVKELGAWLRHRMRMIIWKQWKRPRTKMRNLRRLGIGKEKARQAANTRRGPFWATSHNTVNGAITNKRLLAAGFYHLEAAYDSFHLKYTLDA